LPSGKFHRSTINAGIWNLEVHDMTPSKAPWPFPTGNHHLASGKGVAPEPVSPTEEAIDHGVEESFPASDPVSVSVAVVPTAPSVPTQAQPEPVQPDRPEPPLSGALGDTHRDEGTTMAPQDEDRFRQDELHRPGRQGPASAASGGTRSRSGSNYGDWHPDDPARPRGYDGSARSGDWIKGDKDAAEVEDSAQELRAPTALPNDKEESTPDA
jgi:hypothetical protein